jgi:glycosyltransferase involved in cell wall biosynthesis
MDISLIICTRNRAASLRQTLASVARLNLIAGREHELLLVNNGSTDDTAAVAESFTAPGFKVRVLNEPRQGQARARNLGLREAGGKVMLFTDDDVELPPNWLETMSRPILSGAADAVIGRVTLAEELCRPWMKPIHRSWLASTETINFSAPGSLVGAAMGFSREVYEQVTFDEELGPGALGNYDDTFFGWQLKEAGFRLAAVGDAPLLHYPGKERLLRRSWLSAAEKNGRSAAYVNHHWLHETISPWRTYYRLGRNLAQYLFLRILKWRECSQKEGMPEWEMFMLERHHRLRHYLVERRRPCNYDLRGLVKRDAGAKKPAPLKIPVTA